MNELDHKNMGWRPTPSVVRSQSYVVRLASSSQEQLCQS